MIPLPSQPKIVDKKNNLAIFEIDGLWPGYGVTIGNSLRRVLLSSMQGSAVTQAKIKGAQHEFSAIQGVMEDVVTILLNLKQLRFKLHTDEPQKATLSVRGEKDVRGSDFDLPSQVELMNKDSKIATLTDKKSELEIEVTIERGMGYEPVESRKRSKLEIGTIALDAIFTPVRRVSYRVENVRIGERTDFDRLVLELETDGSLTPEEALNQASEILVGHFALIGGTFSPVSIKTEKREKEEKTAVKKTEKNHAKAKKRKKTK